jgi:hypothetical protein
MATVLITCSVIVVAIRSVLIAEGAATVEDRRIVVRHSGNSSVLMNCFAGLVRG